MKKLFFFILLISNLSNAQELRLIEDLILEKKYEDADKLLKEDILEENKISSEITFLFGKNSYFLKKYNQSINWLNKY